MHSNHTDEGAPSASTPEEDRVARARQVIADHDQAQLEAFSRDLDALLDKYGLTLKAVADIRVVAR